MKHDGKHRQHKLEYYKHRPPFKCVEGMGTPVYDKLSPDAVWFHARLYAKFNGRNNRGNLSVTYAETKSVLSQRRHQRALWELVGWGFVDIRKTGRATGPDRGTPSIYAFSDRWRGINGQWVEGRHTHDNPPPRWAEIQSALADHAKILEQNGVQLKHQRLIAIRRRLLSGRED